MKTKIQYLFIAMLLLITTTLSIAGNKDWIERSNEIAYKILESNAQFAPEFSGQQGVNGYDEEIFDLEPNLYERQIKNSEKNLAMIEKLLKKETDPFLLSDFKIMQKNILDEIESNKVNYEKVMPYGNIPGLIFAGFNGLLDKQVPLERQKAALVRLKKYTGEAKGYVPFVEKAKARLQDRMNIKGLILPYKGEVQQDIERAPVMISGLTELFKGTDLSGWEESLELLQSQLTDYTKWVEETILPNTRPDAKLPRELYELGLKNWGVDDSPEELMVTGQVAFMNIRNEMMALAPLVAKQKGYDTTDYREVIKLLKKEQLNGDVLMFEYQAVIAEIDEILKKNNLISVPNEPARVRMATAAETAQQPAAHLDVPRLIGNTGEFPEFIVPMIQQNEDGSWPHSDYAFSAMMWTLSAHEARPGHEMQFTTMLRGGVSTARAMFAFNSANVEGWALYAESITKPYMPLDGQLISLQARLLRAARIWLDPMLNLGLITPDEAKRILMEDVVEGESNAQNEIERYTYRIPGQATAYYYGYEKLQALRAKTELKLKDKFKDQEFHDFLLAQGLLPPEILAQSVVKYFIEPQLK
ncbi:MAG TPA: DUF885 domain-containing protein [Gammaproteobacteria bacterium]|nr:DUF885 domain-containing protein [Xanthomonadales bacterium]MCB1593287.1 DUF885 domain-containing protein [Xanthomonadales bacterium]HOP22896.1 DUF885 domain-containing protein [Gammaproteobacteria bacterium]HPI96288.1 DUF885 domain-containing protein [Gammaproteobacteria bacterium]HPQ87395.1 DUF885 domain-containing protein [Gammaproteobacteria bacterium]